MSSFRKPINAYRQEGSRVKGRWTGTGETLIIINGSFQPVKGSELENTPELRRRKGAVYKIYTDPGTGLRTTKNTDQADQIEYNGQRYEVIMTQFWDNNVINHEKYFVGELLSK